MVGDGFAARESVVQAVPLKMASQSVFTVSKVIQSEGLEIEEVGNRQKAQVMRGRF